MRDLVDGWPFWVVLVVFWLGATARGTATYWVGRGVRAGGGRTRWAHHLERPAVARAERFVRKVGPPAVTLGFLTIGLQSAINASSGMLRMPLRRFLPAVVLGALLWAVLYTTVGLTVVDAALGRVPWWWLLGVAALVGAVVLAARRLRRRVEAAGADRS
ncbi:DedA family protein [Phycicoccus sonneratiae]|uniref:VTT domain-containing protein n=1 Tax=Phycicoccus sonneratiae TaxID=2807628 RepID=A0ABS2CMY3_9MICO|nr:VTT domain-containing protein [Phycicoccus sonneraticus]MBM6400526.1 VTT domain-containing protein [Phycicoccus sonneraticus]